MPTYDGPIIWGTSGPKIAQRIQDMQAAGGILNGVRFYNRLSDANPQLTAAQIAHHNAGRMLFMSYKQNTSGGGGTYLDQSSGRYDAKDRAILQAHCNLDYTSVGKPRFSVVCYQHEIDGATSKQSGTAAQARAAQLHFYEMLRSMPGNEHVLIAICFTEFGFRVDDAGHFVTPGTASRVTQYWPGNIVDIVGTDPYAGATHDQSTWRAYPELVETAEQWSANSGLAPDKLIAILETGCPESNTNPGTAKAAWMDKLRALAANLDQHPRLKFCLYWDQIDIFDSLAGANSGMDYRADTTTLALTHWVGAGKGWNAAAGGGGGGGGPEPPVAVIKLTSPAGGPAPLTVHVDASQSTVDPAASISYDWDWGDGTGHAATVSPGHTYAADGDYTMTLTVTGSVGGSDSTTLAVKVDSTPPVNDDLADATEITDTASTFTVPFDTVNATAEAGEPAGAVAAPQSVWFKLAPPAGRLTIDTSRVPSWTAGIDVFRVRAAPVPPVTGSFRSGVWFNPGELGGSPANARAFGVARGRPLDLLHLFPPKFDWPGYEAGVGSGYLGTEFAGPLKLLLSIAPFELGSGASTLAAAAAGAYDAHYLALADNLIADGCGDDIVRYPWEGNLKGSAWSFHPLATAPGAGTPTQYQQMCRNMHDAMMSRPGANFRFAYSVANEWSGIDATAGYPGDGYVHYYALDAYPKYAASDTQPDDDQLYANWLYDDPHPANRQGVAAHKAFADAHNLVFAFAEHGLSDPAWQSGLGTGDRPGIVDRVYGWMAANLAPNGFECYFWHDYSSTPYHKLASIGTDVATDPKPLAWARYQAAMAA